MAPRKITEYPAQVLADVGKPVTEFDDELARLCADMFETMYEAEGVGLAAPQIGLNLRLFVMDCEGVKLVAANPEIVARLKALALKMTDDLGVGGDELYALAIHDEKP